ncbi:helix-turn-helix domain-containing protein [Brochothrix campestris]|uniref:helix-turn-helix domain-containing protein n=1 Tax=Brochothrix campestris TaxID=2757 RepID=UPI0038D0C99E
MKIYEKIEMIRIEKRISKKSIAEAFGFTAPWYSKISNGEINIKADDIQKFAEILEVESNIFFDQR